MSRENLDALSRKLGVAYESTRIRLKRKFALGAKNETQTGLIFRFARK